jgi:hypothetical protein
MEQRFCLTCGEPIKGRADKKFCDDQCRTQYNNKLSADVNNYVRNINNALKRNRRILSELIPEPEGKIKLHSKKLIGKGYNFEYHTHTYTTKTGNTYFFCYEYGYLPLDDGFYMLVKRDEQK